MLLFFCYICAQAVFLNKTLKKNRNKGVGTHFCRFWLFLWTQTAGWTAARTPSALMASLGWGTWWHRHVCLGGWLSCDTWPLSSYHTCSFSPKTAKTWDQTCTPENGPVSRTACLTFSCRKCATPIHSAFSEDVGQQELSFSQLLITLST